MKALAYFLLISLCIETLPVKVMGASVVPLTTFTCMILFPFVLVLNCKRHTFTPVFQNLYLFLNYSLLQSLIMLLLRMNFFFESSQSLFIFLRQLLSLFAGFTVYFVMKGVLVNLKEEEIFKSMLIGSAFAIFISLINIWWGLSGSELARWIVMTVRGSIIGMGRNRPLRCSGLSLEPAGFGYYLISITIPSILYLIKTKKKNIFYVFYFIICMIVFIFTFSTTAYLCSFIFFFLSCFYPTFRRIGISVMWLLILALGLACILIPNNYFIKQISLLFAGEFNYSFLTRFYSTFGPIISFLQNKNMFMVFGYGLGGSVFHIEEIIPVESAVKAIEFTSPAGLPNLKTLWGRILSENGIIGLIFYLLVVIMSIKYVKPSSRDFPLVEIIKISLLTVTFAQALSYGSFATPYFWLWLAMLDSLYIKKKELKNRLTKR